MSRDVSANGDVASVQPPLDLGEFRPPANYAFEPEFAPPAPRPIPYELRSGIVGRNQRRGLYALAWAAVLCMFGSQLDFFTELGKYILPFAYLWWIGLGLAVLWVGLAVKAKVTPGPFRYVTDGIPLVARIIDIVKSPTLIVNGAPSQYAFTANIQLRRPDSDEVAVAQVKSFDFSAMWKDHYRTTYRVGDYATAVYLPNKLDSSVQLYGFLGLRPELGIVTGRSPADAKRDLWQIPLAILIIGGFFGGLIWLLFAFQRWTPVNFDYWNALWPMVIGGIAFTVLAIAGLISAYRSEQRKLEARNREALAANEAVEVGAPPIWNQGGFTGWFVLLALIAGTPVMGAVAGLGVAFGINAWGDETPAQQQPVVIEGLYMETTSAIFRQYFIKYFAPGTKNEERFYTSPENIDRFETDLGMLETRGGRLGWPWVYAIHPVLAAPQGEDEQEADGQDAE